MVEKNGRIESHVREAEGFSGLEIERDGRYCYVVRYCIEPSTNKRSLTTPERFVAAHLDDWFSGRFKDAKSYRPITRLQFIDIETLGLAYTIPTWLIGTARLDPDRGLCLEMLLARDPMEEKTILQRMMEMTRLRPYWISFNGETFDNHRIKKRAQLHLLKSEKFKYLDIFKVAKREYKRRQLTRHRLGVIEKIKWPKYKRENHIPSKQIPAEVKKYWRGGSAERVWHATDHCVRDVMTLTAITLDLLKKGQ